MSGTTPVLPIPLIPEWRGVPHPIIGMLHAPPLPGSPRCRQTWSEIETHVLRDAAALVDGGVDGLMLENFGDTPFCPAAVPPITIAALTRLGLAVRQRIAKPLGLNVLRNDAVAALSIATVIGGLWIRVNVLSGTRVTDQGLITGPAYDLLRLRAALRAEHVKILADVDVKHSAPLAARALAEETAELVERAGADGVIVSGAATGHPVNLTDLPEVAAASQGRPVFVGSGVQRETVNRLLPFCHGLIVGSSLKQDGVLSAPVDPLRVRELVGLVRDNAR